jgi:hypothetical protein
MEEIILTKDELVEMFEKQTLKDTNKGWLLEDKVVEIIALHEVEPKYLQDITNAKYYKIIPKGN